MCAKHNTNRWQRTAVVAATTMAALAGPLTIGILRPARVWAQEPKSFEAASIKPSPQSDEGRTPNRWKDSANGIDYKYVWVSALLQKAYGLKDYQITLPRGYKPQPEFDIVARSPANSRLEDIPLMLRSLLADRFHLTFHRETSELAIYAMVVGKRGPKLKEVDPPGGGLGSGRSPSGGVRIQGKVSLELLAFALSGPMGRPVIDKTGIPGIFDISFDYMRDDAPGSGDVALPEQNLQKAMEDAIGLKLESRKDPIEMLGVDHVDNTPTEN